MLIEAYDDLIAALQALTPEQRKQKPQLLMPGSQEPHELGVVISLNTVAEYLDGERAISNADGGSHPDEVVMLADVCRYDEDGDFCCELLPDGSVVGCQSGKQKEPPFPKEDE